MNDLTVAVGCGAIQCGSTNYAYCNYAIGQYDYIKPWVSGSSCTNWSSGSCANNLCSCNKLCFNGGTLNKRTCKCTCPVYTAGDAGETLACDKSDAGS